MFWLIREKALVPVAPPQRALPLYALTSQSSQTSAVPVAFGVLCLKNYKLSSPLKVINQSVRAIFKPHCLLAFPSPRTVICSVTVRALCAEYILLSPNLTVQVTVHCSTLWKMNEESCILQVVSHQFSFTVFFFFNINLREEEEPFLILC